MLQSLRHRLPRLAVLPKRVFVRPLPLQHRSASSEPDAEELEKFSRIAEHWWDLDGPMRELHNMNPVRIGWIRKVLERELLRNVTDRSPDAPLAGLRILDVGCGGGIASEALASLGAEVTGIDASPLPVGVASSRLEARGDVEPKWKLSYQCTTTSELLEKGGEGKYDAVVSLEVIEHVPSPEAFLSDLSRLVRPEGVLCLSTINKTLVSWLLGIVLAEHVLKLVPQDTHRFDRFIPPEDIKKILRGLDMVPGEVMGMYPFPEIPPTTFPPRLTWGLCSDTSVNYLLSAVRVPLPRPSQPAGAA